MSSSSSSPPRPPPASPPSTSSPPPPQQDRSKPSTSPSRWESSPVNNAGHEGMRGAAVGAAQWGLASALLGVAGWRFSPVYKGLTLQFKVFLQMSGMIFGATIESDRRMREFELRARMERRRARRREELRRYEMDEYDDD